MSRRRVLLVEDEFLVRLILSDALSDAGFEVTEAADGEEGVRLLEASPRFDVIVTDLHMPGSVDGLSLARHARERDATVPVVFATARPDNVRSFDGRREHHAVVAKPYGPDQILAVLKRILPPNNPS